MRGLTRRPLFFRKLTNLLVQIFSILTLCVAVGGMLWILCTIFWHGWQTLSWGFLTNPSKPYGIPDAGIANALLGTFLITLCAAVLTIPPALLAGVYLAEFGKKGALPQALRFCANIMMGMPSIIVGLFVYTILVVPTGCFSGFAGSVALGIIMFPVIMRTTEDMLLMVPDSLRESGLALGMTRARATVCIVCRAAKNGLVTGILLSIARVSGETAPLLFTALFCDQWPTHFFTQPTASAPVLMTEYAANSPFEQMHQAAWGAALVILAVVLTINILTRVIFREKKHAN
ncbi:MAG: phosphate ABC transporter permease PstA [Planctomycetia bacterium]|nr:phosphate ABC transporter permease PstA [Planctomycetia bacterium]